MISLYQLFVNIFTPLFLLWGVISKKWICFAVVLYLIILLYLVNKEILQLQNA